MKQKVKISIWFQLKYSAVIYLVVWPHHMIQVSVDDSDNKNNILVCKRFTKKLGFRKNNTLRNISIFLHYYLQWPRYGNNLSVCGKMNGQRNCGIYIQWNTIQLVKMQSWHLQNVKLDSTRLGGWALRKIGRCWQKGTNFQLWDE